LMLCSSRNYAIGMAHYQMAGGHKMLLVLTGGYLAAVAAILGLAIYNSDPADVQKTLATVATLLLVGEAFGLVLVCAARIAGSVRLDLMSNMIESHRQMPISAARVVLGYLFGTTAQLAAVAVLNALVLALLERAAGIPFEHFILAQIVLGAFAVFVWTASAMGSLLHRQALAVMMLLFLFGGVSSAVFHSWGLLPGASLLVAPLLGETIFNLSGGRIAAFNSAYPVALSAQAAFGAIFFLASCRRYRGSYLTTFNVPMGMALAAIWGGLSAVAIRIWPDVLGPLARAFDQPDLPTQVVAALGVAALVLIVPAYALATWESHHPVSRGKRLLALAGMVLSGALSLGAANINAWLWMLTLLVLAAHVVTVYAGFKRCARLSLATTAVMMAALLFVLWLAPLILEVVRWYILQDAHRDLRVHDLTIISIFSPLGLLLSAWEGSADPVQLGVGLLFQTGLAALLWYAAARSAKCHVLAETPTTPLPQSAPS
jgi:hypothetical protein